MPFLCVPELIFPFYFLREVLNPDFISYPINLLRNSMYVILYMYTI